MIDEACFKILISLMEKEMRFKDLRAAVKNPRTLSIKLKKLAKLGLIKKEEREYRLTEKGLKVVKLLQKVGDCLKHQPEIKNSERIPHYYLAPLIRKYCEILIEILGSRLISIMLFGSIAGGLG